MDARFVLVEVEERDHFLLLLGLGARLQQQAAVVEGEAYHLLHARDDVFVANPERSRRRRTTNKQPSVRGTCNLNQHSAVHVHVHAYVRALPLLLLLFFLVSSPACFEK